MEMTMAAQVPRAMQLFVYGTLKSGCCNYERHCSMAVHREKAWLWGRIYHLDRDEGYPMVEINREAILARGSDRPEIDALFECEPGSDDKPDGDWDLIEGELMQFDRPERDVPRIDLLEAFRPDGAGLYSRVLTTVSTESGRQVAWTYIREREHDGRRLHPDHSGTVCWRPPNVIS
ncbi:hypothetical protein CAP48_03255 [Advenella sp. S44]|nr:hypothetical protein CAP48_03255 [Advenella sp. S44]